MRVRGYDRLPSYEEPQKLSGSINALQDCVEPSAGKVRVCISLYDMTMSIYHRVSQIYTHYHSVHHCYPCISICLHISQSNTIDSGSPYASRLLPHARASAAGSKKQIFPPELLPGSLCIAHLSSFIQFNLIPKPDRTLNIIIRKDINPKENHKHKGKS